MSRRSPLPLISFLASSVFLASGLLREPPVATHEGGPRLAPEVEDELKYRQVCVACHQLGSPRTQRKEEWAGVVLDMRRRSEQRGFEWSEEDFDAALRHLERHGR